MLRRRLFALSACVSTFALTTPTLAQDASTQSPPEAGSEEEAASQEEILVTGSRIARPELEVAVPVVPVTAEEIQESGLINVTDVLIRNPALTASIDGSLSGGANAGFGETGVNLLDLRNLGVDRTLVLVNGRRHVAGVPNSASVDINSIPLALIEKVDVLTGGASAIYGADGVSGVVNFVLKRDFEGIDGRLQAGIADEGDAGTQFASIVAGRNFADGRGNLTVAYEYANSERLSSFARDFSGNPAVNQGIYRNLADIPDNPTIPDRILYNNLTWAGSAPDGAIDLDLDGTPDFTGSGLPYQDGVFIPGSGARAFGGASNTPTAGYFGDLRPETERHNVNVLASFEVSDALRVFVEGKYVRNRAFSVGQPSFDFFTVLAPDNAFLRERFGTAATTNGALLTRDNFDFGIRGERNERETLRFVGGIEGQITDNARYDLAYVFGQTEARNTQTSNLIADRYFAALDAVRAPNGQIVCRSTLDPASPIDPNNFGQPASTFTPGANSPCRPLNVLGNGVASAESLAFVLADNVSDSRVRQHVVSGAISGDFDSLFRLPGGPLGFALGAEYRREESRSIPDALIQSGAFRDFAALQPSSGRFNVKEVFAELNVPILADRPFFELLSFSAAVRLSDYSTIGTTETWKVDGIYAPVRDVRFRGSYAQAVRAPNIGELFLPATGTFAFVTDPCDVTRLDEGTSTRRANCTALLAGLGLTPAQIATFSPSTDIQNTTSRRGTTGGNEDLSEETARTWTAGVVLQPRFIPGLTVTFDWYDIRIEDAVNTPSATDVAELCVDQPTLQNVFCDNIFRATGTGFVLGDGNDPQRRIGFNVRPQNVAEFETAGADLTVRYEFEPFDGYGQFGINFAGGYLDKITFVPSIGAEVDDDLREQYNPRYRGFLGLDYALDDFRLSYGVYYFGKTRRFTTEQLTANPDISEPRYFFRRERFEHEVQVAVDVDDRFTFYGGVNNLFDQKPSFDSLSYPVSGVGRFIYAGARVKLEDLF